MSVAKSIEEHVQSIMDKLDRCGSHCRGIARNRSSSSSTSPLDLLQRSLKNSARALESEVRSLQATTGITYNEDDDLVRRPLLRAYDEAKRLEQVLSDASRKLLSEPVRYDERLRDWEATHDDVTTAIRDFGGRWVSGDMHHYKILPRIVPVNPPALCSPPLRSVLGSSLGMGLSYGGSGQVAIENKDLNRLTDHMRDSWEERYVQGRVVYVNVWDENLTQKNRPNGFIKPMGMSRGLGSVNMGNLAWGGQLGSPWNPGTSLWPSR